MPPGKRTPPICKALQGVVDAIAKENVSGAGQKEQLAFYLNAYNAWILHEALEKYPTGSVKDLLFTFFTSKRIKVAGQQTSFKALEDEVDPRKVRRTAHPFRAELREPQLPAAQPRGLRRRQAGRAIRQAGERFRELGERREAFRGRQDGAALENFRLVQGRLQKGGAVEFINQAPLASPSRKTRRSAYQDYDWALNEAK